MEDEQEREPQPPEAYNHNFGGCAYCGRKQVQLCEHNFCAWCFCQSYCWTD